MMEYLYMGSQINKRWEKTYLNIKEDKLSNMQQRISQ